VSRAEVRPGASLFVWGIWALMLVADLAYGMQYGLTIPYGDEWDYVSVLTGDEPLSLAWAWVPQGGHRPPMTKLLWAVLIRAPGPDFHAGVYVNALLLGAFAAAMIVAAKSLRGWTSYADAFFPLALLHWGHGVNIAWWWQINEVLPQVLVGAL